MALADIMNMEIKDGFMKNNPRANVTSANDSLLTNTFIEPLITTWKNVSKRYFSSLDIIVGYQSCPKVQNRWPAWYGTLTIGW